MTEILTSYVVIGIVIFTLYLFIKKTILTDNSPHYKHWLKPLNANSIDNENFLF